MSFVDELRSRFQTKQAELEKCREEVRIAKEKESRLRDEVSAIQVLLNAETPKNRKVQDNVVTVPSASATPVIVDANKAEEVRALIQEHGALGLTPTRIREMLAQKGVLVGVSYIYGILIRAKKMGRITERNGRYYPAEKEKAAS